MLQKQLYHKDFELQQTNYILILIIMDIESGLPIMENHLNICWKTYAVLTFVIIAYMYLRMFYLNPLTVYRFE